MWFQNRRAKWRKHTRLQMLREDSCSWSGGKWPLPGNSQLLHNNSQLLHNASRVANLTAASSAAANNATPSLHSPQPTIGQRVAQSLTHSYATSAQQFELYRAQQAINRDASQLARSSFHGDVTVAQPTPSLCPCDYLSCVQLITPTLGCVNGSDDRSLVAKTKDGKK